MILVAIACGLAIAQEPARATTTVTARVFDQRGAPLAGAGLVMGAADEVLTSDALERPLARSGDDGRITASLQVPVRDDYGTSLTFLVAAKDRLALAVSHHPALERAEASPVVDLGDLFLFDAVTLRGRVVDPDGRPIAGVRVSARDAMRTQYDVTGGGARPHARSAVQTDAKGLFVLPCVPDGGLEVIFAKAGWFSRGLFPVGRETPLTVELRASGFVSGRALDAAGEGVATTFSVVSECGPSNTVRTAADGTFQLGVAWPGRFRLRNHPAVGSRVPALLSPVLDGPREGLELRPAPADEGVRVVVRAVDEASGAELADFRAGAESTVPRRPRANC
jgi:hypothetical protein